MLTYLGLWAALGIAGAIVWPALVNTPSHSEAEWYNDMVYERTASGKRKWRKKIWAAPPLWVFALVCPIIVGLITAATILFVTNTGADFAQACCSTLAPSAYTAILALMFTNVSFYHMWYGLFFKRHYTIAATVVTVVIFLTATAVYALLAWQRAWLAFGLYSAYVVVSLLAVGFSIVWNIYEVPKAGTHERMAMKDATEHSW